MPETARGMFDRQLSDPVHIGMHVKAGPGTEIARSNNDS